MVRADPKVRRDKMCVVCKKPRRPERSERYAGLEAARDAFCSVECARVFHAQPNLDVQGHENKLAANRGDRPGERTGSGFRHGTRDGYRLCACDECREASSGERQQARLG